MYILAHAGITVGVLLVLAYIVGRRMGQYDIRILLIGSMLPDIIDKPLNIAGVSAGRGYGHTALFCIALIAVCARYNVPELAFGSAMHILLDAMWNLPNVLFWPVKGISLPPTSYNVAFYWERVLGNRYVQATEGIGIVILVLVIMRFNLYRVDHLRTVVSSGSIET